MSVKPEKIEEGLEIFENEADYNKKKPKLRKAIIDLLKKISKKRKDSNA